MFHLLTTRSLLAATVGLALLVGCQGTPPSAPVQPAASAQQAVPTGLNIRAEAFGTPMADAEVKVYRPGSNTPIATGQTGADGRLQVQFGNVISAGGGNVISAGGGNVISAGGGNVISAGGGNVVSAGGLNGEMGGVISAGGGNVVSAGGLNLVSPGAPLKVVATKGGQTLASLGVAQVISAGGGNVISAGGGNVISAGGGNVVSAGGLNYDVLQLSREEVVLTVATTLAVVALGDRLDGAAIASVGVDGNVIDQAVQSVLTAFDKLSEPANSALEAAPDRETLQNAVLAALNSEGRGQLPETTQTALTRRSEPLKQAFREAAALLAAAINTGVQAGGVQPPANTTTPLVFGGVTTAPVQPTAPAPTGTLAPVTNTGVSGTISQSSIQLIGNVDPPGFTPFDFLASADWTLEARDDATMTQNASGHYVLTGGGEVAASAGSLHVPDGRHNSIEVVLKSNVQDLWMQLAHASLDGESVSPLGYTEFTWDEGEAIDGGFRRFRLNLPDKFDIDTPEGFNQWRLGWDGAGAAVTIKSVKLIEDPTGTAFSFD